MYSTMIKAPESAAYELLQHGLSSRRDIHDCLETRRVRQHDSLLHACAKFSKNATGIVYRYCIINNTDRKMASGVIRDCLDKVREMTYTYRAMRMGRRESAGKRENATHKANT